MTKKLRPERRILNGLLADEEVAKEDLDELRAIEETDCHDFKRGMLLGDRDGKDKIRRAIVAFANSAGGVLMLGAEDAAPHNIDGIRAPTGKNPRQWVADVIHGLPVQVQPVPKFQELDCEGKTVVLIGVHPSGSWAPVIGNDGLEWPIRIDHSTTTAPRHLVEDVLHGHRRHPLLDLRLPESQVEVHFDERDGMPLDRWTFSLHVEVENASLISGREIIVGFLGWDYFGSADTPPRHLLPFIAREDPVAVNDDDRKVQPVLHHQTRTITGVLRPFCCKSIDVGSLILPFCGRATLECGVYALADGSPPAWYQLTLQGDPRHGVIPAILERCNRPVVAIRDGV